jgi:hypothetical protein
MAKNKENSLALSKKDFEDVGINVSLTTNDMVEVIANDIFDKFVTHVNSIKKEYNDLVKEYQQLFWLEAKETVSVLKGLGHWPTDSEDVDYSESWEIIGTSKDYTSKGYDSIKITEDINKGMIVKLDGHKWYVKVPIAAKVKIRVTVTADKDESIEHINAKGITGAITTYYSKVFKKEITVSSVRFKTFENKMEDYKQRLSELFKMLPANGILTIERFTREARVKMNKKLLASHGPEFKAKLDELYGIKL